MELVLVPAGFTLNLYEIFTQFILLVLLGFGGEGEKRLSGATGRWQRNAYGGNFVPFFLLISYTKNLIILPCVVIICDSMYHVSTPVQMMLLPVSSMKEKQRDMFCAISISGDI